MAHVKYLAKVQSHVPVFRPAALKVGTGTTVEVRPSVVSRYIRLVAALPLST